MEKLQFTKVIKAPAQKVWQVLWNEATYPEWTKAFNPEGGSTMQSDWQVGGKTLFLDEKRNGMISTIKSINEPYEIVFEHLGEMREGVEDTTSEKVRSWAGSLEEYHLIENNGETTVTATVSVGREMEAMITRGFTSGLEVLQRLCEQ